MQRKGSGKQPLIGRAASPGPQRSSSIERSRGGTADRGGGGAGPSGVPMHAGQQQGAPAPPQGQARKSHSVLQHRIMQAPAIAPGQPGASSRNREKLIKLPETVSIQDRQQSAPAALPLGALPALNASIFQDIELPEEASGPGRMSAVCVADALDRRRLEAKLKARGGRWLVAAYPDVLYGQYWQPGMPSPVGDVFYFDYGVVVLWGLPQGAEQSVLRHVLADCAVMPLSRTDVETDELQYKYTPTDKPSIQNDTVTINAHLATQHKTKLAIAFALSQSTKLSVYEERVLEVVEATKGIPGELAEHGEVASVGRTRMTQLIGEVFIQKSDVNLLSTVLDTPEFFWGESDQYNALYRSAIEYLEFDERVELLNSRFQVLQEMLEIARSQQNVAHTAQLDYVVIILILLDLVTLLLQFVGSLELIHRK